MNIRQLKQQARQRLSAASYSPGKLTLIHGGVIVALSLILSLISLALDSGIDSAGGLSGMRVQNVLMTVKTLLTYAQVLLLPFWQIGILFAFLQIVRHNPTGPHSLLQGFRRFGPVLRLTLLEMVLYCALCMACAYISSFLSMFFPNSMYALLMPVMEEFSASPNADIYQLLEHLPQEQILDAMLPMLLIFATLYLVCVAFVGYRLRFARYLVLEESGFGALKAMHFSFQLTKGNCISLLKLDFSFWWYYLLQALAMTLCYGDLMLDIAGVNLSGARTWVSLICYCIYGGISLYVDYLYRPRVEAAYALAYDSLKNPYPAPFYD